MKLIERYLEEIGTYLPKDLRETVSTELRANLESSVESRLAESPALSPAQAEAEVLKELGPPHEVADRYVPRPRVLFGPRLYPAFIRTMKIAIAVLVGLAALGVVVDLSDSISIVSIGRSLIAALSSVLIGSLVILGIAVVVFSVIERTAVLPPPTREEWDPGSLPEIEDPDKVSIGDRVASIAFLVVALVVLNFFRQWIGAHVTSNEESGWIPLLGPVFESQLWLLNVCLVLDLVVNFLVLLKWRWTTALRWASFAVNCLYLTWLGRIAFGPSILEVDPAWMASHGWSAEAIEGYEELFSGLSGVLSLNFKLGFAVACVFLAFSFFKLLRRMFTGP
jgi:hypothetical protein